MNDLNLKKQMPKNLGMNLLSFITNVLIGLWLVPYLISNIGIAAYGLIPLAMFLSEYIGIIIQALNTAINRFLLISLQENNAKDANEIFNTSLIIMSVFIVIQAIIITIVLLNLSNLFQIPIDLKDDALLLFLFTFLGFSLSLFRAVFTTSIFAYNRIDIIMMISITHIVIRVGIIIVLFAVDEPLLRYVGIANFIASLFVFVQTIYWSNKIAPLLKVNLFMFNKKRVRELSSMGGWVLVNLVGVLLLSKIDLYLVNKFLGAAQTGEYAIIIQVNTLFRSIAGVLAGVLAPVTMIYYAKGEFDKLINMLRISAKIMAIILAIPLGIMAALSGNILNLWLGEDFQTLGSLLTISLLHLVVAIPVIPFFPVNVSFNKIKLPAILVIIMGFVNILLIYFFLTQTKLGLYGVVIARLVVDVGFNAIFIPMYAASILKTKKSFLNIPIISIISFTLIYFIVHTSSTFIDLENFTNIVFYSIVLTIFIIPIFLVIFFTKDNRTLLLNLIYKKNKKGNISHE